MKAGILIITVFISGCVNPHPSPITEPDPECLRGGDICNNFADNLTSFYAVVNAYRAYATTWEHTSDQKKSQATNASEITFYGLLASAIGLATKSPETVIAGGSVGAAGTIYSKRYALEIQAHNYDLAAQSMQCMYMAAAPYQKKSFPDDLTVRNASLNSLITVRKTGQPFSLIYF